MEHFVFKKEWREALKGYSAEIRAEVYEAVLAYAFEGEVLPMSELAKMAFNFIKLSIDAMQEAYSKQCERNREKANKRWGKNAEQCQDMPSNAKICRAMQTDANGCEDMPSDAIKSNQIKSNNISLSLSLSHERDAESEGLTPTEREKIFEIFHFERNIANANKEAERFINHYEASGWCRGNSNKPVRNKVALAKSWKVEREERQYPDNVCKWLHAVYRNAQANNYDAGRLFQIERVTTENNTVIVYCRREVAEVIEANKVPRDFALTYKVRREA